MIAEARTGASFGGLAAYLVRGHRKESPERVEWIAARNLPTTDMDLAPRLMRHTASLSKRVQKPVYHLSVSFPEQEQLGQSGMLEVADRLLAGLGLERHQAIILAHNDTAHPHLHLMINRVHPETGKAWSNSRDFARIERSLRTIEKERNLRIVPGRHSGKERDELLRPTRGETQRARREAETPLREWGKADIGHLRSTVAAHFFAAESWADLEERLAYEKLSLRSKGQGLVVTDGARYCKLSSLGKQIRLKALHTRFGQSWKDYDLVREPVRSMHGEKTVKVLEKSAKDLQGEERRAHNRAGLRRWSVEFKHLRGQATERLDKTPAKPDTLQRLARLQTKLRALDVQRQARRDARQERFTAHLGMSRARWNIERENLRIARNRLYFEKAMARAFIDPVKARQVWRRHAAGRTLDELIEQGSGAMGQLRGFAFMGYKSESRKLAEHAFLRLVRVWRLTQQAEQRRERLTQNRARLAGRWASQNRRYRDLSDRLGNRQQRKQTRQRLDEARIVRLRQLEERDIWESRLTLAQKQELARHWEDQHGQDRQRQAELERAHSLETRIDWREADARYSRDDDGSRYRR